MHAIHAALWAIAGWAPALASANEPPSVPIAIIGDVGGSLFSESPGARSVLRTIAVAARIHRVIDDWQFGPAFEWNGWLTNRTDGSRDTFATLQIGVDGQVNSANNRIQSLMSAGFSILLDGNDNDKGTPVGFYLDVRPVAYRWDVAESASVIFSPINFALLMPDPTGIPIVEVQFRSIISMEFRR